MSKHVEDTAKIKILLLKRHILLVYVVNQYFTLHDMFRHVLSAMFRPFLEAKAEVYILLQLFVSSSDSYATLILI